ncbi:MAG: PQQ-binding-like beta-propeller repeat protein, partial [Verrucomicrobiota bacterium]
WRATGFASVNAASPVLAGEDSVFITEGYGRGGVLLGLDPQGTLAPRWKAPRFAAQFSTPRYRDGYLYGFSGSSIPGGELVCYEAKTGEEQWRNGMTPEVTDAQGRTRRTAFGRGSLLSIGDHFLAIGESGSLAWLQLSPESATILSVTQLFTSPETWGTPAYAQGRLYVIQQEGPSRLICYDL